MNISIKVNPVYIPYLDKKQFMQIFYGGSSSGKSYFICQKIILDNLKGANWLVCRNVARTMRNSVFNEVKKAISAMELNDFFKVNKSDMVITNIINGKQIIFTGLDDPEKVKSITPQNGVVERIFIEEATEIRREALKQLEKRLRGSSGMSKHIIMAFNPILKSHWIYKEFFGGWEDNKNSYCDDTLSILKTTFRDNKFLTVEDRSRLENETDEYYYNVYSLGNWGVLGNVIFKNWHVEDLSGRTVDNIYYGMDFGYSNDPNAIIKIHVDNKHKRIYVLDEFYRRGMSDDELLRAARAFVGRGFVMCDSAEPKTIDYLSSHGVDARAAAKGADSINRGIRFLKDYEIIVSTKCQCFKNEIEQYHWLEDKHGEALPKAADVNNHLIDALRYSVTPLQYGNIYEF